ncbi:MAG: prohibitin family protein [Planctomycetota bacterium]|nr:prohibitin family protein [Planctomycetota bacterium]
MTTRILVAAAVFVVVLILVSSVTTIPTGHIGVVTTFGRAEDWTLDEGIHLIAFWRSVNRLSVRTQEVKEVAQVPTKEGLTIELEASLLFSLKRDRAREVFQKIGPTYIDIIVVPQFRSILRGVTVNYEAKALYMSSRSEIEQTINELVKTELEARGIIAERVLMRRLTLPHLVTNAIDEKLAAEQQADKMKFVLEKEKLEAERKIVEAGGIAKAQEIIQGTLSDNYIRYLWVKALEVAATSPTTTIYVPVGPDGLPLILPARTTEKGK